jgi:hypothetical protein
VSSPPDNQVPRRTLIGDAERDRVIAALREHYAAGRLRMTELERRVDLVLAAEYADEAEQALAELPGATTGLAGSGSAGAGSAGTGFAGAGFAGTGAGASPDGSRAGWLRRRGHAQVTRPATGWVRTGERFRDPSSGAIMRVWVDPADDSRHYVPDGVEDAG